MNGTYIPSPVSIHSFIHSLMNPTLPLRKAHQKAHYPYRKKPDPYITNKQTHSFIPARSREYFVSIEWLPVRATILFSFSPGAFSLLPHLPTLPSAKEKSKNQKKKAKGRKRKEIRREKKKERKKESTIQNKKKTNSENFFSLAGNRTPGLPDPKLIENLKAADVNHYTTKDG